MAEDAGGPWICLSHCGFGKFDPRTNALLAVACPSRYCATWVPLIDGRIAEHPRALDGRCPWIGVRVADDRADLLAPPVGVTESDATRDSGE